MKTFDFELMSMKKVSEENAIIREKVGGDYQPLINSDIGVPTQT